MALGYDLKAMFRTIFAPRRGEIFVFMNDRPLAAEKRSDDHNARAKMTEVWHSTISELGGEMGFEVEPIVFYEVTSKAESGWKGEARQGRKKLTLEEKLDSLGPGHILVAITKESITWELMRRIKGQNFRTASAPNVRIDLSGFAADYSKIPLRAEALNSRLNAAAGAEVIFTGLRSKDFSSEMKFYFDLRGEHYHVLENGECRSPGRLINLPSGCANIVPYAGKEGDPRGKSRTAGQLAVYYDDALVVFRVREGKIVEVMGESEAAQRMRGVIFDPSATDRQLITKLGLGLNEDCRVCGVRVADEKTMGLHWGYGKGRDFPMVYHREATVKATVTFLYEDGRRETVMREGLYDCAVLGEAFSISLQSSSCRLAAQETMKTR